MLAPFQTVKYLMISNEEGVGLCFLAKSCWMAAFYLYVALSMCVETTECSRQDLLVAINGDWCDACL